MNNKITTAIGIFLLVFTMVMIGAVSAKTLDGNLANSGSVVNDVAVQSTIAAYESRQQAYETLIQQANDQLMNANATFSAMAQGNGVELPTESAGITPEQAVDIANAVAITPDTQQGIPELVSFEGNIAYEVKYDQGAIYVSFATGEILLNGTSSLVEEVTIEKATEIAKDYLGLTSIYLSDIVSINGQQLFRVIFNAGHIVYIDQNGQIIYVQMYVAPEPTPTNNVSSGNNGNQTPTYHDDDDDGDDD